MFQVLSAVVRALAGDRGLLAVLVARDVHAVEQHAGHGPEDAPRVAGVRHLRQLLVVMRRGRAALLDVDERRLGGDRDRFLHRGDLHGEGELTFSPGRHRDFASDRREPGSATVTL